MIDNNSPKRYTKIARALHWLVAVLVVLQFTLAYFAEDLPLGVHKLALLARHKSFGMTILMLALLRLCWRSWHSAPALPATMHKIERVAAHVSHYSLYTLLFAMPLTGWLMSSAKSYSVSWFGLFTWPNLIGPNEDVFNTLKLAHYILAVTLFVVATVHMLAAFKHHFWDRDDILKRMI